MNIRFASLLFIGALAIAGVASGQETRIHGLVVDARTGEPIPEARVRVLVPHVAETVTDRSGAFDLDLLALPAELEAARQGYALQRVTIHSADTLITLRLEPQPIPVASVEVTTQATERGSAVAFTDLDRKAVLERYWAQDVPMLLAETPGVYAYSDAGNGIDTPTSRFAGSRSAASPSRSTAFP